MTEESPSSAGDTPSTSSPPEADRRPAHRIFRHGVIATIWLNTSRAGHSYYGVEFARAYNDEAGASKSTGTFTVTYLLTLAHAAALAYEWINANPLPKAATRPRA